MIGATGHRDLRDKDREAFEKLIGEFLDGIRKSCPHTPILLACQLAEGADRLTAKLALATGAKLVAALPMVQGLFEADFTSQESKAEFRDLARQAETRFSVPLAEGCTVENIREDGPQRNKQYAAAGTWIVEHCDVLIALWDGVDRRIVGGTDHIVAMAAVARPVLHIHTPRASKPNPADAAPSGKMIGSEAVQNAYQNTLTQIEAFNAAAHEGARGGVELAPAAKASLLSESALALSARYALLSAMSQKANESVRQSVSRALQVMVAAVLALLAYAAVWPHLAAGVVAVVMLGAAGFLLRQWGSLKGQQARAVEYGALAEAVCVQFFWKAAGVEDAVKDAFLRGHRGPWVWMQRALSAWNLPVAGEKGATAADSLRCIEDWAGVSHRQVSTKCPGAGPFVAGAIAFSATAVVVGMIQGWGEMARGILVTLAGGSLASAAAVRLCVLETSGASSTQIGDMVASARDRVMALLEKNDATAARRVVRDLGRDVLAVIESNLRLGAAGK